MLRKRGYIWICILSLFFLSFNISYFSFTIFRDIQFNTGLKTDYKDNSLKLRETKQLIDTKYANIDMNNKTLRKELLGAKIQRDYYYYLIFSDKYILNAKSGNLLIRLPEMIGKMHALMRLYSLISSAGHASIGDFAEEFKYIEEWKKKGEKEEGDWWGKFEKSQEYQNFLMRIVLDRRNEEGETIDEVYEKINNRRITSNSILLNNVFNYWVIELEKDIAKEAYKNYNEDIRRNDYYSALMDINIIHRIPNDLNKIEKFNLISYLYINTRYLSKLNFIRTQLIYDIMYIIILSFALTFILYHMTKKLLGFF